MKINNIKYNLSKRIAPFALAVIILAVGCKKSFLDVDPQGQPQATEFWKTQADASKAVNAMYANLRSWENTAFAAIAIESMGADEAEKGSSPSDAPFHNNFDNFTATSTEGQLKDFWKGQYQNINLANQVLDNIPAIEMDPALKSKYLAEAKFVRAYSYFRLVRAFGDVPLRLNVPKDASAYNIPRSPKAVVWAAIEKDLTEAEAVLPATQVAADIGRFTKGAALSLHAKVAMYQNKWNDVLSLTNTVMTMGYSLFPNFEGTFRIPNENNSESVFEIQCQELIAHGLGDLKAVSALSLNAGVDMDMVGEGFLKTSSNDPLYPFGFGLSYTTFEYAPIILNAKVLKPDGKIQASVVVKNSGNYDGNEIVQLYIQDVVGSITRPVKELKGFQKIFLKKGESKTVNFSISIEDLKFYNADLKYGAEPGEFKIFIGSNLRDVVTSSFSL